MVRAGVLATAGLLALAAPASAGLWLSLERPVVAAGEPVAGRAVAPCGACGPGRVYLVSARHSGLRRLLRPPRRDDRRFRLAGRFGWERGGRFAFRVPDVPPGVYQLHALRRNGPGWTLAPASPPFRVAPAGTAVRFGSLRVVVPSGWRWRHVPGPGRASPRQDALWVSNRPLRSPPDPVKGLAAGEFVLTLLPLGAGGSATSLELRRRHFLRPTDPAVPRGRAVARHAACTPEGPCVSIRLEYRGERVPAGLLAAVNGTLLTLHAARRS